MIKVNVCTVERAPIYDGDELVDVKIVDEEIEHNVELTFTELMDAMKLCDEPSSSPCSGGVYEWASHRSVDFRSGVETEVSYHYSRENPDRNKKYWHCALTSVFA